MAELAAEGRDPDGEIRRQIEWMLALTPEDRLRCAEEASRVRANAHRVD